MLDKVGIRVSGAELARSLGVSRQAVAKAAKAGRITRGPDGKFDALLAAEEFTTNADQSQRARSLLQPGSSAANFPPAVRVMLEQRARLARAQAETVEMKNAILRREYAPVAMLEDALARAARQMVGVLEALPGKLRRRLPDLPAGALTIIEHEICLLRNLAAAAALEEAAADHEGDGA